MSELLNQLNDDELDFTVSFKDTDGNSHKGDFLDIVLFEKNEYVIIEPEDGDGYVDIFRIMYVNIFLKIAPTVLVHLMCILQ